MNSHLIPGYHAVKETLLKGGGEVGVVWIARGKSSPRVREIVHLAREKGVQVQYKKTSELNDYLPGMTHQGIAAVSEKFSYADLKQITKSALQNPDCGLVLAADHITDEGNLGALIRTAVFFGVHGLILPKDRSAAVTAGVRKRSSGAYVHLPVTRVVNLSRTLGMMKKEGFWIIGAAGESSTTIYQFDWCRDLVLVLGREDKGLTRSIREQCDQLVAIPPGGKTGSLNVSVAGGVILAEVMRRREASMGETLKRT
ncbi:23S rRNA (guanosine(2251)-2'-O)-methyltransferase RlmB [Thermodesulfobacteriota bacterium]